ncbi:hypothetical protein ZIOFF_069568 [Zingiber officinale]|uniref:Uncharacterized protein n=1 Tax=Zingiber officinale TaxID=94328 RepID=A0A8J5BH94_ZINOF|nr:hypothetical protein ZIOFF_069568 [Zingiber officinale]
MFKEKNHNNKSVAVVSFFTSTITLFFRTTMNGKKGSSIQINICLPPNATPQSESMKKSTKNHNGKARIPMRKLMMEVWEFAREDTNRVTFSLKVGLACLLVSLLILIPVPYQVFGTNFILEKVASIVLFIDIQSINHCHRLCTISNREPPAITLRLGEYWLS